LHHHRGSRELGLKREKIERGVEGKLKSGHFLGIRFWKNSNVHLAWEKKLKKLGH